jgi:lysophosphatidylcholine acyltransferase/lyso-PAF acetyltransferase
MDYSYYLGPDYKKTQKLPKYVSTVVANHSSWADNLLEMIYYRTSFVAKVEVLNVPFISTIARALQCIYISRIGDASARDTSLETIGARQREGETKGFNPLLIHAEGTSTNGEYLIEFKRGAFNSLRAI